MQYYLKVERLSQVELVQLPRLVVGKVGRSDCHRDVRIFPLPEQVVVNVLGRRRQLSFLGRVKDLVKLFVIRGFSRSVLGVCGAVAVVACSGVGKVKAPTFGLLTAAAAATPCCSAPLASSLASSAQP